MTTGLHALPLLQQLTLFAHLIAFAVAVSAVLHEDLAILRRRHIDLRRLRTTARTLSVALVLLWATGGVLIACDIGFDVSALLARPKLLAKLGVVSALTANGVALHLLAMPRLQTGRARLPTLALVLGAISTASWLYASFVGASRLVAPWLELADFLGLYAAVLVAAVTLALSVVRCRLDGLRPTPPAAAPRTSPSRHRPRWPRSGCA